MISFILSVILACVVIYFAAIAILYLFTWLVEELTEYGDLWLVTIVGIILLVAIFR